MNLLHKLSKDLLSLPRVTMYSTWTQWMTAESDSQSNSSETQQRKVAESGSQHMAQGLNEEDG